MIEEVPVIKTVIIGDAFVGKTNILSRYTADKYDATTNPTVGAACAEKELEFNGSQYKLALWDTAGQETYRNLVPIYFRGASIAIIVIDVTNKTSLQSIDYWLDCVKSNIGPGAITILCANKIDLTNERKIDTEELQKISTKLGIPFFETSALTGVGIMKMFEYAFFEYMKRTSMSKGPSSGGLVPAGKSDKPCC